MKKLTLEQGIVLTGYLGKMCCPVSDFHKDVEKRLGRSIWTHQFASEELWVKIRKAYEEDFMKLVGAKK